MSFPSVRPTSCHYLPPKRRDSLGPLRPVRNRKAPGGKLRRPAYMTKLFALYSNNITTPLQSFI